MDVNDIRKKIKWFDANKTWVYADTAATCLKPDCVIQAVNDYYLRQATNPHNTDSTFTNLANNVMHECRKKVADFIHCQADEIIFTSGATESLNLIAQSLSRILKKDDEVILTNYEHSSNLLPWYHLRDVIGIKIVFVNAKNPKVDDFLNKITSKTKIISFTGVSNLVGYKFDVETITKTIKQKYPNILISVDIAQMVPHYECNVQKWNIDFAAFSAHKMFGPTGIGVTYIKKDLQEKVIPIRFGGGMNFSINPNDFCYIDGVAKFEGGTPHIAGMYGLIKAIDFIKQISYEYINTYEEQIYEWLKEGLKDCDHLEIYNWDCHSSTLAFNIKGVFCQDAAAYLGKHNIIVRSGLSCAKLMENVIDTNGVIRASFYVYNSKQDIDKFIAILKTTNKEKIFNELL